MIKREHFGWLLFAIVAGLLVWFLTRKKKIGVSHNMVASWDSSIDPGPPSNISAPPFLDEAHNLVCANGYTLWRDAHTGNYACYKDPIAMPDVAGDRDNIFRGAFLKDSQGNPIPGGT